MTRAAVGAGFGEDGGTVVNVTVSPHHGMPAMAHTGAARAAVEALTRELAAEWARAPTSPSSPRRSGASTPSRCASTPRSCGGARRAASRSSAWGRCRSSPGSSRCSPRPLGRALSGSVVTLDGARRQLVGPVAAAGDRRRRRHGPDRGAARPHRPHDLRYPWSGLRAKCCGCTEAFQASRAGSIPVARSGCHGEWRSLVAHPAGGRAVAGSNPVSPTRAGPCVSSRRARHAVERGGGGGDRRPGRARPHRERRGARHRRGAATRSVGGCPEPRAAWGDPTSATGERASSRGVTGLVAGALAAVDVQDLAGHERRRLQVITAPTMSLTSPTRPCAEAVRSRLSPRRRWPDKALQR